MRSTKRRAVNNVSLFFGLYSLWSARSGLWVSNSACPAPVITWFPSCVVKRWDVNAAPRMTNFLPRTHEPQERGWNGHKHRLSIFGMTRQGMKNNLTAPVAPGQQHPICACFYCKFNVLYHRHLISWKSLHMITRAVANNGIFIDWSQPHHKIKIET